MRLFSSESVLPGHPDKVCDRISDTILDAYLFADPDARVAVEVMATAHGVILAGEVLSYAFVDRAAVARSVLLEVYGRDWPVTDHVVGQSPEIAAGVTLSLEVRDSESFDVFDLQGAGDQGLMFGYATDETPELMPFPVVIAHGLAEILDYSRRMHPWLGPDGKTQVTVELDDEGRTARVHSILVSIQHDADHTHADVEAAVRAVVLLKLQQYGIRYEVPLLVNPSGSFILGGPEADAGLTGRKIIVDTYGGAARHGGGAFSGKDPSKVDRSGAYAARWVAKHVVAAGLANRCEVQVSYAIGQAAPVGVYVDTFGTGQHPDDAIADAVLEVFDLRPAAIADALQLRQPMYSRLTAFGHLGRHGYPWEAIDKARLAALQAHAPASAVT